MKRIKVNKSLLLVLLIVVGCVKAPHDVSYKGEKIKGGDCYAFTTGCCGYQHTDTVEVIGFIQECILVKDNNGTQQIHNTKYFKNHIKPIQWEK